MFGDNTNDNTTDQQQQAYNGGQPIINPPATNDVNDASQTAPELPAVPTADDNHQSTVASDFGTTDHQQHADTSVPAPEPAATPAASTDTQNDLLPNPTTDAASADDLLNIKQQALQQLTPLVDHLDQTPKEEFRTTMMMIQATDNQELVKKAFDAAQKIEDDKERAQAFLDIINEINYFTQHHEQQ